MPKTKILCIFDGFGIGPDSANNCISRAKMPNFRRVLKEYYWTTLNADGESVGQEEGLVGNSEVGHMNIGGLQLVPQLSYQITQSAEVGFELATKDRLFDPTEYLQSMFESKKENTIHLIGLFSTGTIHSDMRHWIGSIESAGRAGTDRIVLHLITDGRDSDRCSLVATWQEFVTKFETRLKPYSSKIFLGSVGGRFYAMDRDKNWDRVIAQVAPWFGLVIASNIDKKIGKNIGIPEFVQNKYGQEVLDKTNQLMQKLTDNLKKLLLTEGQKNELQKLSTQNILEVLKNGTNIGVDAIESFINDYTKINYSEEIFDETLIPACTHQIQKNDTIWLLNFRSDRMKQFATVLCDLNKEFQLGLDIIAMNDYGIGREVQNYELRTLNYEGYKPIFRTQQVHNTLAETIASLGQTQLHIAETEKYAHVTYFLNGGKDTEHTGEDWVVIPSNKVESHAEKPEMKAKEITDYILECLEGDLDKNFEDVFGAEVTPFQRGQSVSSGGLNNSNQRIPHNKGLKELASQMRQNQTKTEKLVWNNILKDDKMGFRFIRQKPLLNYIADFYCFELRLVIEIDGDSHNYSIQKDQNREKELADQGLSILRFRNDDVYNNLDGVKVAIEQYISSLINPPKSSTLTPLERGSYAQTYDYIIVNYANPDMVGHTGDIDASVNSMEFLDEQFGRLLSKVEQGGHSLILIADHGNMEFVGEYTLSSNPFSKGSNLKGLGDLVTLTDTEHNPNAVPCVIVDPKLRITNYELVDNLLELENKMRDFSIQNQTITDQELITKVLTQKNYEYMNDDWLSEEEIEVITKHQPPLWYAGILLMLL